MPSVAETIDFARHAHQGQTDKGGRPYFDHVHRVFIRTGLKIAAINALTMVIDTSDQDRILMAALLHDVIEDGRTTWGELQGRGYDELTLSTVHLLSRDPRSGSTYLEWIHEIVASNNLGAILIKLADNQDNNDAARIAQLPPENQGISDRYKRSIDILSKALMSMGLGVAIEAGVE